MEKTIYIQGTENIVVPREGDLGFDLVATKKEFNWEKGQYTYYTGVRFAPENPRIHALVFPRSSISKMDLRLANSVAIIDSSYRGEIKLVFDWLNRGYVPTENAGEVYEVGDKIAQLVFFEQVKVKLEEVEELDETERGEGGFGSTGK